MFSHIFWGCKNKTKTRTWQPITRIVIQKIACIHVCAFRIPSLRCLFFCTKQRGFFVYVYCFCSLSILFENAQHYFSYASLSCKQITQTQRGTSYYGECFVQCMWESSPPIDNIVIIWGKDQREIVVRVSNVLCVGQ